jgi:BA14K-like protein
MRSKFLAGSAAAVLAACALAASIDTASAAPWGWHRGWGWPGAVAAGLIGGAVAAATSPFWASGYFDYYPGYAYKPAYDYPYGYPPAPSVTVAAGPVVAGGGDVAYCEVRFRSYNPATGTYLGYDGLHHPCP